MGISLDSLSITSAFNSIISFFKSQENNSKWKDLTTGSEGTFLIRMLANILSNISYRLVTARRENYISTANLRSSVLGIALNLGYSAHRGTNQKRMIRFEPNSDYVIPPFTTIGTYNDEYDVIYLGDVNANTHLRDGLILNGPFVIAQIYAMSSLSKTISLIGDITDEIAVGDIIKVEGTTSDGRYTIAAIKTKTIGSSLYTLVTVNETIENDYSFNPASAVYCSKVSIQEFKTVIGKIKTITWNAGTSKTQPFTRFENNISEDCILYLDGEEVPLSNVVRDLKNDTYLIRTNPYSSVDILYLNHIENNTHRYGSESIFTLKYIELADIATIDYSPNMSGFGTLTDTLTIDNYTSFEEIEDIKVNAPINHDVQHLIRSKNDFAQRLRQQVANIVETSYKAITPTYTLLTYLKDDSTTIQQKELELLNDSFENEKYFGTPNPDIAHPTREAINLNIQIYVTDKLKDLNDVRYDISNIIKTNYSKMLAQTFDVYALERLIEQLSYIKWARVSVDVGEWISRGTVDLGTIIKVDESYYKADKILGISGSEAPAWNIPLDTIPLDIDLDDIYETIDGGIVWRAYKRLDVENITKYQGSNKYSIGDYVYTDTFPNFMFKVVDLLKYTGATSGPDTSAILQGDFIVDGEIIWVCKEYSSSYETRMPNTNYRLGTSCNIDDKSFEVVSYIGKTGYIHPTFEKAFYTVEGCVTPQVIVDYQLGYNSYFQIVGDQRQFFEVGSTVSAFTDRNMTQTFTVKSTLYNATLGRTNIYLNEEIDTYKTSALYGQPQYSAGIGSVFIVEGDDREHFKVGDYIRALGNKSDSTGRIAVSYDYTIIDVEYKLLPGSGVTTYGTYITVKNSVPTDVTFETLVAAGYTSIRSALNNSFILNDNMSDLFTTNNLIKAKTDEGTLMTYTVTKSYYQELFDKTFVMVKQDILSSVNYEELAPAWKGTEDGEIKWQILEDPNIITYGWDKYNDITYKLSLGR